MKDQRDFHSTPESNISNEVIRQFLDGAIHDAIATANTCIAIRRSLEAELFNADWIEISRNCDLWIEARALRSRDAA
jgi:hypothetical protein